MQVQLVGPCFDEEIRAGLMLGSPDMWLYAIMNLLTRQQKMRLETQIIFLWCHQLILRASSNALNSGNRLETHHRTVLKNKFGSTLGTRFGARYTR